MGISPWSQSAAVLPREEAPEDKDLQLHIRSRMDKYPTHLQPCNDLFLLCTLGITAGLDHLLFLSLVFYAVDSEVNILFQATSFHQSRHFTMHDIEM
jgi:hypothetical protein